MCRVSSSWNRTLKQIKTPTASINIIIHVHKAKNDLKNQWIGNSTFCATPLDFFEYVYFCRTFWMPSCDVRHDIYCHQAHSSRFKTKFILQMFFLMLSYLTYILTLYVYMENKLKVYMLTDTYLSTTTYLLNLWRTLWVWPVHQQQLLWRWPLLVTALSLYCLLLKHEAVSSHSTWAILHFKRTLLT